MKKKNICEKCIKRDVCKHYEEYSKRISECELFIEEQAMELNKAIEILSVFSANLLGEKLIGENCKECLYYTGEECETKKECIIEQALDMALFALEEMRRIITYSKSGM